MRVESLKRSIISKIPFLHWTNIANLESKKKTLQADRGLHSGAFSPTLSAKPFPPHLKFLAPSLILRFLVDYKVNPYIIIILFWPHLKL